MLLYKKNLHLWKYVDPEVPVYGLSMIKEAVADNFRFDDPKIIRILCTMEYHPELGERLSPPPFHFEEEKKEVRTPRTPVATLSEKDAESEVEPEGAKEAPKRAVPKGSNSAVSKGINRSTALEVRTPRTPGVIITQ